MENGNVEAMIWVRVVTLNVTTEISSDRVLFVQTAMSLQLLVTMKFKGVSKFDYMKWPLMKQADNKQLYTNGWSSQAPQIPRPSTYC